MVKIYMILLNKFYGIKEWNLYIIKHNPSIYYAIFIVNHILKYIQIMLVRVSYICLLFLDSFMYILLLS